MQVQGWPGGYNLVVSQCFPDRNARESLSFSHKKNLATMYYDWTVSKNLTHHVTKLLNSTNWFIRKISDTHQHLYWGEQHWCKLRCQHFRHSQVVTGQLFHEFQDHCSVRQFYWVHLPLWQCLVASHVVHDIQAEISNFKVSHLHLTN